MIQQRTSTYSTITSYSLRDCASNFLLKNETDSETLCFITQTQYSTWDYNIGGYYLTFREAGKIPAERKEFFSLVGKQVPTHEKSPQYAWGLKANGADISHPYCLCSWQTEPVDFRLPLT